MSYNRDQSSTRTWICSKTINLSKNDLYNFSCIKTIWITVSEMYFLNYKLCIFQREACAKNINKKAGHILCTAY